MASLVMVATDFSAVSAMALGEVTARFPGSQLVVVHVIDPRYGARVASMTGLDADDVQHRAWNRADVQLDETVARLRSEGHDARAVLVDGELAPSLTAAARRHQPSTIVLGLEHREAVDRLPWQLAIATGVSVLVVPEKV